MSENVHKPECDIQREKKIIIIFREIFGIYRFIQFSKGKSDSVDYYIFFLLAFVQIYFILVLIILQNIN